MIAITRDVPKSINAAQLTHVEYVPIDVTMAELQHREYRRTLEQLGVEVVRIPADDAYPDCVFIEDTAIVLSDLAIITRPGAPSRRGETKAVADVLEQYRPLVHIEAPATLDGGDVLVLDDTIYVGLSSRTNEAAIAQLRYHTRREVIPIEVGGALHLKTAVTRASKDALIVNREWIDVAPFAGWQLIDIDPSEPFAANVLLIGDTAIVPSAFPRTRTRIEERGIAVRTVDAAELAKAEGGVTCCALLVTS